MRIVSLVRLLAAAGALQMSSPVSLHAQDADAAPKPFAGETRHGTVHEPTAFRAAAGPAATPQASPEPSPASGRPERGVIGINGMFQATSNGFTADMTLTQYVEAGRLTATYESGRPPGFDAGGAVYVWRRLAVGAAITWLSQDNGATLSAEVPHPFVFGKPRTVAGVVGSAPRSELSVHPDVSWTIPVGHRVEIAPFGGPSFFHVDQTLAVGVIVSEAYPFDTATFTRAETVKGSESHLGFNVGIDVTASLSNRFGIGVLTRYSRSSVDFPVAEGQEVTVHAGGLQVGGGLRVRF